MKPLFNYFSINENQINLGIMKNNKISFTNTFVAIFTITFFISSQIYCQYHPDTLKKMIASETSDSIKITYLNQLAFFYAQNKPDSAITQLNKSLSISKRNNFTWGIARSYINFANLLQQTKDYTSALLYADSAISLLTDTTYKLLIASYYNVKGNIYMNLVDYAKALGFFQKALDILQQESLTNQTAIILNNLGNIHCKMKNFKLGIDYYKKEMEIIRDSPNIMAVLGNLINLGNAYGEIDDYENAVMTFSQAKDLAEKGGNIRDMAYVNANLGLLYYKTDTFHIALELLKQAKVQAKEVNDNYLLVKILSNLGKTCASLKRFNEAMIYAEESMVLAKKLQNPSFIATALNSFISIYHEMGNYKKATEHYARLLAINENIYTEEQQQKIAELETLYNVKEKENQIAILDKENELQKQITKNQKQKANFLIFVALLLIVVIILIIRQLNKSQKNNKELTRKNLELMNIEKEKEKLKNKDGKYLEDKKEDIINKLEDLFENEKIYRSQDITMDTVASKLNTNRSYLSGIVNSYYKCNFKTIINRLRVKDARIFLVEDSYRNYTIEAIAHEVGFVSKSVFNTVFKNETGITPSIFRRNALHEFRLK